MDVVPGSADAIESLKIREDEACLRRNVSFALLFACPAELEIVEKVLVIL